MPPIWEVLGIPATQDERTIRLAYSARLKVANPEDKPEEFKILRAAYETAMKMAATKDNIKGISASLISAAAPVIASPPKLSDYQLLCIALEKLVVAPSDSGDTKAALKAILASPDFQRIDVQAKTEIWLLRLIVFNAPRSDILLLEAISTFGWSDGAGRREIAELTRRVFQRVRDLKAYEEMAKPSGHHHRAYVALTKPFERPRFKERLNLRGLYWEVKQCLDFIRRNHPALLQDLNRQSVAAWQAELVKIRFPAEGWLALLAMPPAIVLFNFCAPDVSSNDIQFLQLLLLPIPVFAGAVLYTFAWRIPRRIWRDRWRASSPAWVAWGWAPALLLILMLAALIPDTNCGFTCIMGLGFLAGAWAIVTAEQDPRLNQRRGKLSVLFLQGPVFMLCGFAVQVSPEQKFGELFVTGCIATFAIGAGNGDLTKLWFTASSNLKRRLITGVSAVILLAGALTWQAMFHNVLEPLAIATTLCAALMTIVPAMELPASVLKIRYQISLPVIMSAYIAAGSGVILVPYLSIFLLAWAATTCGVQIARLGAPKIRSLR